MEAETGVTHFEEGGRSCKADCRSLSKLEKARQWVLPSEPAEGTSPSDALALA